MSDAPISASEEEGAEGALLRAARAFEAGAWEEAGTFWRHLALPAVRRDWPRPLADAISTGIKLVLLDADAASAAKVGRQAVETWRKVELWLERTELPYSGGRSTPAHFRRHRRDPGAHRVVALGEHLRLAGGARAVALNNQAHALVLLGRAQDALPLLRQAASARREAFGWREAGLGAILGNLAAVEREAGLDAGASEAARAAILRDPVSAGADRFLALAAGQSPTRRALLAAAELVPILRRPAG